MSSEAIPKKKKAKGDGSLTQRTIGGLAWTFAEQFGQMGLKVVVFAILGRLLGPHDFGLMSAAMVVIGFVDVFGRLGIAPAVIQRPDLTHEHIQSSIFFSAFFGLAAGAVVFFGAALIANLFAMPSLESVMRVLALVFPIKGLAITAEALLLRNMRFSQTTKVTIASYLFGYSMVSVGLAWFGWGVWALVWGQLAQAIMMSASYLILSRNFVFPKLHVEALRGLLGFGAGVSLAQVGNYIAINAANFVVGRFLGVVALGFYSRAYAFMMFGTIMFGSVVDRALFPAIATIQNEPEKVRGAYRKALGFVTAAALPMSCFCVILAPELVHLMLGQKWDVSIFPFQILMSTLVFRTGYKMCDIVLRAKAAVFKGAWRQWLYAAEVLVGGWFGHFWGVNGVAIAVAVATALHFCTMLHLANIVTGLPLASVLRLVTGNVPAALILIAVCILSRAVGVWASVGDVLTLSFTVVTCGAIYLLIWTYKKALLGPDVAAIGVLVASQVTRIIARRS